VSLVEATAQSLNCGYLRLGHEVGLPAIASVAQQMGITTSLIPAGSTALVPSMILGSIGVHPIDIASAYATVADGGTYHKPSFIDHITDRSGDVIYTGANPGVRVFSTQIAAEAELCLRAVVTSGTGTAAELYDRPVAGKTGTTSGPTDAWFNGFVPQLEATVWMGNPTDTARVVVDGAEVYGGTYPTRTWRAFMEAALASTPVAQLYPVDYAGLPPTKYITSRQLQIDDKSAHGGYAYLPGALNGAGYPLVGGVGSSPGGTGPPTTGAGTGATPGTGGPATQTTAPGTPPATTSQTKGTGST
jgi:penicillin-binding protein 1A